MPSTILRQRWGNLSRVFSVLNLHRHIKNCFIYLRCFFQSLTFFAKSSILDVDSVLNSVTDPQEPVTGNNFYLPQLWITSPTYRLAIACMYLHLVLLSQSQSSFKSQRSFFELPYQQVSSKFYKVLCKIYDGVVQLLLRN